MMWITLYCRKKVSPTRKLVKPTPPGYGNCAAVFYQVEKIAFH